MTEKIELADLFRFLTFYINNLTLDMITLKVFCVYPFLKFVSHVCIAWLQPVLRLVQ